MSGFIPQRWRGFFSSCHGRKISWGGRTCSELEKPFGWATKHLDRCRCSSGRMSVSNRDPLTWSTFEHQQIPAFLPSHLTDAPQWQQCSSEFWPVHLEFSKHDQSTSGRQQLLVLTCIVHFGPDELGCSNLWGPTGDMRSVVTGQGHTLSGSICLQTAISAADATSQGLHYVTGHPSYSGTRLWRNATVETLSRGQWCVSFDQFWWYQLETMIPSFATFHCRKAAMEWQILGVSRRVWSWLCCGFTSCVGQHCVAHWSLRSKIDKNFKELKVKGPRMWLELQVNSNNQTVYNESHKLLLLPYIYKISKSLEPLSYTTIFGSFPAGSLHEELAVSWAFWRNGP